MEQIVDELSFFPCYASLEKAREGMVNFIELSRAMADVGFLKAIKTPRMIKDRSIADGYTVYDWSIDKTVAADQRVYFLINATKAPYIEDLVEAEEDSREIVFESRLGDRKALGLGLAFLWDSPALSLDGYAEYADPATIDVKVLTDTGEIESTSQAVQCLKSCTDIDPKVDWLRARLQRTFTSGEHLWRERERVFPHLSFCERTKKQILGLVGTEQHFHEVVRHLFAIEDGVSRWTEGPLLLASISYSTESEQTLKNAECRAAREIMCPDGKTRLFAMHTKIWSSNQRIHYFPELHNGVAYIGHVGVHLKTIRY